MRKLEFVDMLAERGYTKVAAEVIVRDVFDTLTGLLAVGEEVQIHGFGTFSVRESKPRSSVDYQTKEVIVIEGHRAPRFTPGKVLKRVVRYGYASKFQ